MSVATNDVQGFLNELTSRYGVVGTGLALLHDGQILGLASGYSDVRRQSPMTADTICLVGSTTKVMTATLVMQLVDEGRLSLDDPITRHLPELRLPGAITVRQLLSHTSGLDVGPYSDHGRDHDAVRRYVASLGEEQVVSPPGKRWGYSNAAYVVAGRLVEVLRGTDWDEALRRHLLEPAGLEQAATLPEQAVLHPVALPHARTGGDVAVCQAWGLAGRSLGPTGSTLAMSAGDLIRFAQLHLAGGVAGNGVRVLSANGVNEMQVPNAEVTPGSPFAQQWALGWFAADWGVRRFRGHAGHNLGAGSHVALFPDVGGALAMVFNTIPGDAGLHHELFSALAAELFGAVKPEPWLPVTPISEPALTRFAGRFACSQFRLDVTVAGDALRLVVEGDGELGRAPGRMLPALDGRAWGSGELGAHAAPPPAGHVTPELFFSDFDSLGRPRYCHHSVFAARRIDLTESEAT